MPIGTGKQSGSVFMAEYLFPLTLVQTGMTQARFRHHFPPEMLLPPF
jgi:hypothetical protein